MFKNSTTYLLLAILFAVSGRLKAQEALSLSKAIETTLENNYGLKIAENKQKISENNKSLGNAGFLPKIDLSADQNFSIDNSQQEFITGETIDRNNAKSNRLNAGVLMEWTLFDGMARFTDYNILEEESELTKLEKENEMESKIAAVTISYYGVVKEQQKLKAMKEVLKYSGFRLSIAKEKYDLGGASKTEYLQAKVDYNSDSSAYLNQRKQLINNMTELLGLMSSSASKEIYTDSVIPVKEDLKMEALKEEMIENNLRLEIAQKQKELAVLEFNRAKADHYPELKLNSSYDFLRSRSEAGFVSDNQNLGFSYGISLSFPVFDGFNINRRRQNAKIAIESSEYAYRETNTHITNELYKYWRTYEQDKAIFNLEKENLSVARENMELAIKKYELGSISALELRDIQENYIKSHNRLIEAKHLLKTDETNLLLISGKILK